VPKEALMPQPLEHRNGIKSSFAVNATETNKVGSEATIVPKSFFYLPKSNPRHINSMSMKYGSTQKLLLLLANSELSL
jgi:hypothetical protein